MSGTIDARVMVAGVMTGTTTIYSQPSNVLRKVSATYQAKWSNGASPVGTVSVMGSNFFDPPRATRESEMATHLAASIAAGEWEELPASSLAVSGNSGSHLIVIDLDDVRVKWIVCKYVNASGTGTLAVHIAAEG